ncbi:MAG: hypothetical protein JKY13_02040 [Gammaproteobacteria bacterium]|nr:hypothetical protein [Gammaproteobacteria bacterium]
MSVPNNLSQLSDAFSNPILASAPSHKVNEGVYGVMHHYFTEQAGVFAFLLFLLLYFPCISTMAVMKREIGARWAYFSMAWTTGLAYGAAVIFYQAATWLAHPWISSSWIIAMLMLLGAVIVYMRHRAKHLPPARRVIPIQQIG